MEISKKQQDIINSAMGDCDIRSFDIPSIDLYVDQILSLMTDKITSATEPYRDKLLTKTMINNYSKDGLITPIKGKKYSKEQIIQTLLIYFLKGTLSMGEISRFFEVLYKDKDFTADELISFYDGFIDEKDNIREQCSKVTQQIIKDSKAMDDKENSKEMLGAIMSLLCASAYLKTTASLLFNEYYPEIIPEDNEKEKDKEKDKKKDKKKS